jgi:hypothetical protein
MRATNQRRKPTHQRLLDHGHAKATSAEARERAPAEHRALRAPEHRNASNHDEQQTERRQELPR